MESPLLELKIVSANDLQKPSPFSSGLQPYVVASLSGVDAQRTPVDSSGGRYPIWNYPLPFSLPAGDQTHATLNFQIFSRRFLAADKLIGEVRVPLADLFRSPATADPRTPAQTVSYQVKKPSGRPKGVLTFSYKLAGNFPVAPAEEPIVAYPPPKTAATGTSIFYPPPPSAPPADVGYMENVYPPSVAPATSFGYPAQVGGGYGYPGQTGYGYGSGCGYSGAVVQPKRKKNNGLGLGAGLLGGALTGLVVGDLVSDASFDFGGGDGFF